MNNESNISAIKSVNSMFSLLNEAIDDYENGNVITEEEMLAELDSVDTEE